MRAAIKGKVGINDPTQKGGLICVQGGSMWPRVRRFERGLVASPECACCGDARETSGHRWYDCDGIKQLNPGEPPEQEPILEQLAKTGKILRNMGMQCAGEPDWDTLELAYGLLLALTISEAPPLPAAQCWTWVDCSVPWKDTVHIAGGSKFNRVPELMYCSWSVVQPSDEGIPVRAQFGIVTGHAPTVPRAERCAALRGLRAVEQVDHVVTNHEPLAVEGCRWSEGDASARGTHADIWRAMRRTVQQRNFSQEAPRFDWVSSRKTAEEAEQMGLKLDHWLGNA
ncbi:unnamed protein product [Prorocentrum cordatum]|uniref:Uncharacterized protein n=1 Tax=Prorocentrum cordatum TaxID=2364126 RepID=A0ABN9SIW8_9DINO|nr:unnamed protein product [Polarella glacialis]